MSFHRAHLHSSTDDYSQLSHGLESELYEGQRRGLGRAIHAGNCSDKKFFAVIEKWDCSPCCSTVTEELVSVWLIVPEVRQSDCHKSLAYRFLMNPALNLSEIFLFQSQRFVFFMNSLRNVLQTWQKIWKVLRILRITGFFGPCISSCILETRERNVSETGSVGLWNYGL
jgi:hypothetical protein